MFSSQTVLRTTRPIIVSRTSKNQTVNGTAHFRFEFEVKTQDTTATLYYYTPLWVYIRYSK
jgi:hypothetical protein